MPGVTPRLTQLLGYLITTSRRSRGAIAQAQSSSINLERSGVSTNAAILKQIYWQFMGAKTFLSLHLLAFSTRKEATKQQPDNDTACGDDWLTRPYRCRGIWFTESQLHRTGWRQPNNNCCRPGSSRWNRMYDMVRRTLSKR